MAYLDKNIIGPLGEVAKGCPFPGDVKKLPVVGVTPVTGLAAAEVIIKPFDISVYPTHSSNDKTPYTRPGIYPQYMFLEIENISARGQYIK